MTEDWPEDTPPLRERPDPPEFCLRCEQWRRPHDCCIACGGSLPDTFGLTVVPTRRSVR